MTEDSPFRPRQPRRISAGAARHYDPPEPEERAPQRSKDRSGIFLVLLVLSATVAIAALIVILFVPPIALLDSDEESDPASATATGIVMPASDVEVATVDQMPDLPDFLTPASFLYTVRVPTRLPGPYAFTLRLIQPTQDQRNLGAYTFQGGAWERLTSAILTDDGASARIALEVAPPNIAILRRLQFRNTVTGRLPAGAEISSVATNNLTIINPVGFTPGEDASLLGRVEAIPPDLTQPVYPVVFAGEPEADIVNQVIASTQLRRQHINNILLMVQTGRYDGVDIDYQVISPALRDAFTEFVTTLADELRRDGRGLTIAVPLPRRDASGINEGAYNITALGAAADLVKLVAPRDPSIWLDSIQVALPWVLDRIPAEKLLLSLSSHSVEKSLQGFRLLTQREALGLAAQISVREAGPIRSGQRVTLVGDNIFQDAGASGLFWDRFARMVSFVAAGQTEDPVTVWIENRFSIAFKLQAISEFELGGLAIEDVSATDGAASVWEPVIEFLEQGTVSPTLPNDQLFVPIWEVDAGELSGSGREGWVVWESPAIPGQYEARLILSDGDVRVGRALAVTVEP
ncbi:MAG: glycosyl hydrolase family 18 protein [Chloroflexi bacterium]|nr:glycosyl hydrolase family 18 protein [Chloroflexota bacterium]